ncbi:MAG: hypothetical protein RLY86_467 [Pseudomonadota bacterium]|jgi:hypothetical protein
MGKGDAAVQGLAAGPGRAISVGMMDDTPAPPTIPCATSTPATAIGAGPGGPVLNGDPKSSALQKPGEIGGPRGPEPTRFGDWEIGGRCTDF